MTNKTYYLKPTMTLNTVTSLLAAIAVRCHVSSFAYHRRTITVRFLFARSFTSNSSFS